MGLNVSVTVVNGFRENRAMDLMGKYLSRVRPESNRPKKKSYNIYSKILEDDIWVVPTDKELQGLIDEGVEETIFTLEEVSRMIDEGVTKEGLKAIHKVKNAFPVSGIEDISKES